MPRRGEVRKRVILPDPVYGDDQVTKFTNIVMFCGKKAIAENIVYGAFKMIEERTKEEPLKVFRRAIENCQPAVEVKSRRVGGANYQVPVEVPANRRVSLAIRWILSNARSRPEKGMNEKLANELNDAANLRGGAIKKKDDVHRMAEANRAFAHFRW